MFETLLTVSVAEPAVERWREQGFVILPGFMPIEEMRSAIEGLADLFPTAGEFHDRREPDRCERFSDEFGGIDDFPFDNVDLSLLAVPAGVWWQLASFVGVR